MKYRKLKIGEIRQQGDRTVSPNGVLTKCAGLPVNEAVDIYREIVEDEIVERKPWFVVSDGI